MEKNLDSYEYNELLKKLQTKVENIGSIVKPDEIKARLKEIEATEQDPSFWQDIAKAGALNKEKTKISNMLAKFSDAHQAVSDAKELFELANSENDEETINSLFEDAKNLDEKIVNLEISMLLSGEDDGKKDESAACGHARSQTLVQKDGAEQHAEHRFERKEESGKRRADVF